MDFLLGCGMSTLAGKEIKRNEKQKVQNLSRCVLCVKDGCIMKIHTEVEDVRGRSCVTVLT